MNAQKEPTGPRFNDKSVPVIGGIGSFGKRCIAAILEKYNLRKRIVFSPGEVGEIPTGYRGLLPYVFLRFVDRTMLTFSHRRLIFYYGWGVPWHLRESVIQLIVTASGSGKRLL